MNECLQNALFAYRIWRKSPAVTLPVLLILALGIGSNTAIFSVVDAIWLRPLPIRDAHGLLHLASHPDTADGDRPLSYPEVQEVRAGVPALVSVAVVSRRAVVLRTDTDAALLSAAVVSSGYFSTMGVVPVMGSLPRDESDGAGGEPEVILSSAAWRKYFAGDALVVGKSVTLNTTRCIVAGVLPAEFHGADPFGNPAVWLPLETWLAINPGERTGLTNREFQNWDVFARLAPGVSLETARLQAGALSARMAATAPAQTQGRRLSIERNDEIADPQLRSMGGILGVLAVVILLIAAINVSILLLAFGGRRRRELATRIACGATRSRLMRQLITENAALAGVACLFALPLGYLLIRLLPGLLPATVIPVGLDFRSDGRVLFESLGLSSLAIFGAGLVPAMKALRFDLVTSMKAFGSGVSLAAGHTRGRSILVAAQIAGSVLLLAATGLLCRSMLRIGSVDPGFDRHKKLVLTDASLGMTDYNRVSTQKYYERVVSTVSLIPGVERAALASRVPLASNGMRAAKTVYFDTPDTGSPKGVRIGYTSVGSSYFSVMGTRLLQGRVFSEPDGPESPRVVVINENVARRFFPRGDAIGSHLRFGSRSGIPYEITGIVEDGKYADITETTQPFLFLALTQEPSGDLTVIAETKSDPATLTPVIRQKIRDIDSRVPIPDARTLDEHLRFADYTHRISAELVAVLAALGLAMAMIGLYGLMSYVVDARSHEIGVRVALGGHASDVVWLVLRSAASTVLAGLAVGSALALSAGHAIHALLFGVKASDPVTFAIVPIALSIMALIATALPLRAALRVDPIRVLRQE